MHRPPHRSPRRPTGSRVLPVWPASAANSRGPVGKTVHAGRGRPSPTRGHCSRENFAARKPRRRHVGNVSPRFFLSFSVRIGSRLAHVRLSRHRVQFCPPSPPRTTLSTWFTRLTNYTAAKPIYCVCHRVVASPFIASYLPGLPTANFHVVISNGGSYINVPSTKIYMNKTECIYVCMYRIQIYVSSRIRLKLRIRYVLKLWGNSWKL